MRELNEVKRRYFEHRRKEQLGALAMKTAPPNQFAGAHQTVHAAGLLGATNPLGGSGGEEEVQ